VLDNPSYTLADNPRYTAASHLRPASLLLLLRHCIQHVADAAQRAHSHAIHRRPSHASKVTSAWQRLRQPAKQQSSSSGSSSSSSGTSADRLAKANLVADALHTICCSNCNAYMRYNVLHSAACIPCACFPCLLLWLCLLCLMPHLLLFMPGK
jgi:hypothetical protein